jgi:hypothetical protein
MKSPPFTCCAILLLLTSWSPAFGADKHPVETRETGRRSDPTHSTPPATVLLTLDAPPAGPVRYRLPYEGENTFAIAIPRAYRPALNAEGPSFVTVRPAPEEIVYVFRITPGTETALNATADGVEVTFHPPAPDAIDPVSSSSRFEPRQLDVAFAAAKPANMAPPATATPTAVASAASTLQGTGPAAPVVGDSNISEANIDLSVPESPAFAVLGLSPQTVIRPATPRELATTLLNGIDDRGNFHSGMAIDTSPYLLFAGPLLTINKYRASRMVRFLANTQFSFATTKGASDDDKSMRMALGVHLTLFDKGDPRLDRDIDACYESEVPKFDQPISPALAPEARESIRVTRRDGVRAAVAACQQKARKRNWNNSSWIIAAAPSWLSPTGETGDFEYNGAGVWTSFAYGFEGIPGMENTSQLILHARYRNKEIVPVSNAQGQFFLQDTVFLGGRFRVGSPDFIGNFEGVYLRTKSPGVTDDGSYRLSIGAERKVARNLWFTLSIGGNGARGDGHNKGFVLTSFKWALSPQPDASIIQ